MKGLILVAGKGTRLRPFSLARAKTLIPVANKPLLEYCIESLKKIGINEIGIVLNPIQKEICEYIDNRTADNTSITLIYQPEAKGIGDAVRQASDFLKSEPFILLLGDNLINDSLLSLKEAILSSSVNGAVMLTKVSNPSEYGIAHVENNQIIKVEEKPKNSASNLAIIGAYAFDSNVLTAINHIQPSSRGEYEITDAIQWLINHQYNISYQITNKEYSDVGTIERWLEANRWVLDSLNRSEETTDPTTIIRNCKLIPPVHIDKNCVLTNSTIGPYVSVSHGAVIDNCKLQDSIVLENVYVRDVSSLITHSIFGKGTKIDKLHIENTSIECIFFDDTKIVSK
ncbi:sugar phosphate nucleotidyltransferase [Fictibacillus sp. KU28468]|uniref:sugar phosphate nucleotidyltransferase n=1 Tax=Fictibacillus sp. KU28468 TaxID=2991053 RepID=UPI00223D21BC|nr:sugar phosphate nucleotidyltransferase [Fictibacillus sp. KU28468]UZJ77355.1 sugar phosphate nucleotidyltransferase [Fictibacillus sp. KU28468]